MRGEEIRIEDQGLRTAIIDVDVDWDSIRRHRRRRVHNNCLWIEIKIVLALTSQSNTEESRSRRREKRKRNKGVKDGLGYKGRIKEDIRMKNCAYALESANQHVTRLPKDSGRSTRREGMRMRRGAGGKELTWKPVYSHSPARRLL